MKRSYYYAGASRIAMRVKYDTADELYYVLTDHLGSTSLTYRATDGQTTPQYNKPWGEYRPGPGSSLPTDRTFQGQRDAGWGLAHFGARWFDSSRGRFAQADTIVPGAGNSIVWDRYAGMLNNSVNYTNPSGHEVCDEDGNCYDNNNYRKINGRATVDWWAFVYGITFEGDWSFRYKSAIIAAAKLVGAAFSRELGGKMSAWGAFRAAFGLNTRPLHFLLGNKSSAYQDDGSGVNPDGTRRICDIDAFGCTVGATRTATGWSIYLIKFASFAQTDTPLRWVNNVIHEMGHLFNQRLSQVPSNSLTNDLLVRDRGFYGDARNLTWQQSMSIDPNEIFADQFLGWTYGKWGDDDLAVNRSNSMGNMQGWITSAMLLP